MTYNPALGYDPDPGANISNGSLGSGLVGPPLWGGSGDRFFGWDTQPGFMFPSGNSGQSGFNGSGATGGGKKPAKVNYQSRKTAHDAALARARARKNGGNGGNGGSTPGGSANSMGMDTTTPVDMGQSLPAFGSPSMARVNSIVNALMRESSNQYTHGNQDLYAKQRSDLIQNMRAQLGQDRGIQALKALGMANTQRSLGNNAGILNAENAARQQIEQSLNAQGSGTGNTMAGIQAGSGDVYNADLINNQLRLGDQSNNQFMDAMRAAGGQSALENARVLRSAYQQGIMQNNRALQDIRSRKPLTRLEVEKQIQDMFLAKKLGEANYATAGEGVLTAQQGRQLNQQDMALKRRQLNAQLRAAKTNNKDRETVMGILYGSTGDVKTPVQNPDGTWTTITQTSPGLGAPTSVQEAITMLASSGFTGKKWQAIARQVFANQKAQQLQDAMGAAQGIFGNSNIFGQ